MDAEGGVELPSSKGEHDEPVYVGVRQEMGRIGPGDAGLAGTAGVLLVLASDILIIKKR